MRWAGVREEGVYVPPWTRDIVTRPVNTGFFEAQPVTQPVTRDMKLQCLLPKMDSS
jgi:hypothetical protein